MNHHAVVGTYSDDESDGLHSCTVTVDGEIRLAVTDSTRFPENPSYLTMDPSELYFYVVHEVPGGGVSSFHIPEFRSVSKLNEQDSGADGPCHCCLHPSGEYLFVSHYTGGAVSMLPIAGEGSLEPPTDIVYHTGSGPNRERQTQPHPHSATVGPNGRYLYVADLGTDTIEIYDPDYEQGRLENVASVDTDSGVGPRHMAFHPTNPVLYLITEMGSTVVTYRWDPDSGILHDRGSVSTLPDGFDGHNQASEIKVHPSGNWVYGANRGHDSIAVFAVCDDGTLTPIGHVDSEGEWPRYFCFGPEGRTLYVQNRESNSIDAFRLNASTGALEYAETSVTVPNPACMAFVE